MKTLITAALALSLISSVAATAEPLDDLMRATAMSLIYTERCSENLQLSRNSIEFFKTLEEVQPTSAAQARRQWMDQIGMLLEKYSASAVWKSWCSTIENKIPAIDATAMRQMKTWGPKIGETR